MDADETNFDELKATEIEKMEIDDESSFCPSGTAALSPMEVDDDAYEILDRTCDSPCSDEDSPPSFTDNIATNSGTINSVATAAHTHQKIKCSGQESHALFRTQNETILVGRMTPGSDAECKWFTNPEHQEDSEDSEDSEESGGEISSSELETTTSAPVANANDEIEVQLEDCKEQAIFQLEVKQPECIFKPQAGSDAIASTAEDSTNVVGCASEDQKSQEKHQSEVHINRLSQQIAEFEDSVKESSRKHRELTTDSMKPSKPIVPETMRRAPRPCSHSSIIAAPAPASAPAPLASDRATRATGSYSCKEAAARMKPSKEYEQNTDAAHQEKQTASARAESSTGIARTTGHLERKGLNYLSDKVEHMEKSFEEKGRNLRKRPFAQANEPENAGVAQAEHFSPSPTKSSYPTNSEQSTSQLKEASKKEICIILDNSSEAMSKFYTPLRTNLEMLWDFTAASADPKPRMCIVTPNDSIDLTDDRQEFLTFCNKATQPCELTDDASSGESSVITGLQDAFPKARLMSWSHKSKRYVYIFTNLSACDITDETQKRHISKSLRVLRRELPATEDILVGRWLKDNDILLEVFAAKGFAFLNIKEMASFVVGDDDLLPALCASIEVTTSKKSMVKFTEGKPSHFRLQTGRYLQAASGGSIASKAIVFQTKPPASIHEISANAEPQVTSKACWMQREEKAFQTTKHGVTFCGKLGEAENIWQENVLLHSKPALSLEYYQSQALISAVARFLAIQYNKDHRLDHCAKICFLKGCVIEETTGDEMRQFFYAEPFANLGSLSDLTEFCDASGKWNEKYANESLLRFVQTCFKLSGGDFMLAGLKGTYIARQNTYVLTVPTFLSRTVSDCHISQCNKEYMKDFRKRTRELIESNGWNKKDVAPSKADEENPDVGREPDHKGVFDYFHNLFW